MTYETIKKNYDRKLWSLKMVKTAVAKGVITPEQYHEITGETYIE
ncbi:XkdX family protein [Anaerocolumna sp. MB42-C2]|nr:XkdX family protein [Anaerocolumna sp. MB42-C2]WMJ90613.1 XkdX family protein [Anaerocolumna sp. MB42-C2]